VVQSVNAQGSDIYVLVDGVDVPLSAVRVVSENPSNPMNNVLNAVNQARIQDMVGRYVQALLHNSHGDVTDFVEGRVDYIKISGNQSVLVIGNREVFPWEVASVGAGPMLLGTSHFTNGDQLVDVEIRNGRAYLIFQNADNTQSRVHVERINYAMEAIQYVGRFIQHGQVSGVVESVTLRNSVPFFNVRSEGENGAVTMHEVSYLIYLADRVSRQNQPATGNNTNSNANNNTGNDTGDTSTPADNN